MSSVSTFDYQRLLNYQIPEVRQSYTKKDTALYALSIGLGQDPIEKRQLDFVNMGSSFLAMPSFALILSYPGFWIGNPDTGVDASKVLHGEQSISILRPLPVEGEVVGRTVVTGIVDKGAGKGVLLYSKKSLFNSSTGELVAETISTSFLRAEGGMGGPTPAVQMPKAIPHTPPDYIVECVTRPEQALLYRLNGDFNLVHSDPEVAASAGFPRPILHGMCTFGVVCHALLRTLASYDPTKLREMSLRFSAPVFPGETICTEIWKDGTFRAKVMERDVVVVNNGSFSLI